MVLMEKTRLFFEGKKTLVGVFGAGVLALLQVFEVVPSSDLVNMFVVGFTVLAGYGRVVAKTRLSGEPLKNGNKK